jgi:GNAT superfamily N-acetyltransferase
MRDETTYEIGQARPEELAHLPEIERRACDRFLQLPFTAELPLHLTPPADFESGRRAGLLWVARVAGGPPVGFALVEDLGTELHLEELDVLPGHGRRGLGRRLVGAVCLWATAHGRPLTLCTFRDVPWNAPFYARMGFRELPPEEWSPALARRIRAEAAHGLRAELRVAMRFDGGA